MKVQLNQFLHWTKENSSKLINNIYQGKTEYVKKWDNLSHEWLEENFMTDEKKYYHWLYLIMYNGKAIPVTVGSRKLNTIIIYDRQTTDTKYKSKHDQNCVFGSV